MDLQQKIKSGAVGVMPTDTIYGIVASVHQPDSIERIYSQTNRPITKPFIILVGDYSQLGDIGINLNALQLVSVKEFWPGPVSAIFTVEPEENIHLHRGGASLAVRLPSPVWLRDFIKRTGPIVATSANRSGVPTPSNIPEIKQQLPNLDFYQQGTVGDTPSRLVKVYEDGSLEWLDRQR